MRVCRRIKQYLQNETQQHRSKSHSISPSIKYIVSLKGLVGNVSSNCQHCNKTVYNVERIFDQKRHPQNTTNVTYNLRIQIVHFKSKLAWFGWYHFPNSGIMSFLHKPIDMHYARIPWGLLAGVNTPIWLSLLAWVATVTTTPQATSFGEGGLTPCKIQGVSHFMAKLM